MLTLGKIFWASSVLIEGWTMTSSPVYKVRLSFTERILEMCKNLPGTQLIGVVILCLSPVWRESTMRRTSAVLRPVEAGYERIVRMVFLGSMMKTERMVKAMPLESTLVASWWSSMS